ncbi:MAG: hypothetical protein ACI4U6_02090 [Acutalibacteraceae bacterium]
MRGKRTDYAWLIASIISFLLLSISFLLMPIESNNATEGVSIITILSGAIFWISIVCGIVTQAVLSHRIKSWLASNRIRNGRLARKCGVISFFKNPFAVAADIAMIVGLIGLVITIILTHGIGYTCYVFLALFVFSFSMHCILNGKIFYVIENKSKIQLALQKERVNQSDK